MNIIEDKASKPLNRTELSKIKKDRNTQNTDISKLLELKAKYQKNDKLFYFPYELPTP